MWVMGGCGWMVWARKKGAVVHRPVVAPIYTHTHDTYMTLPFLDTTARHHR